MTVSSNSVQKFNTFEQIKPFAKIDQIRWPTEIDWQQPLIFAAKLSRRHSYRTCNVVNCCNEKEEQKFFFVHLILEIFTF